MRTVGRAFASSRRIHRTRYDGRDNCGCQTRLLTVGRIKNYCVQPILLREISEIGSRTASTREHVCYGLAVS